MRKVFKSITGVEHDWQRTIRKYTSKMGKIPREHSNANKSIDRCTNATSRLDSVKKKAIASPFFINKNSYICRRRLVVVYCAHGKETFDDRAFWTSFWKKNAPVVLLCEWFCCSLFFAQFILFLPEVYRSYFMNNFLHCIAISENL